MEKKLKIEDFEDKTTQNGKSYTRFRTSDGWMSCFDEKTGTELKKQCGNEVSVETKQQGNFENILKVCEESKNPERPERDLEKIVLIGYAKDIFCEIIRKNEDNDKLLAVMDFSIQLVKEAEKAF